jgi:hypothetical protein
MLASTSDAPMRPHGVNVGAAAASLAHVPTWPARLQRIDGSVQAELQQTLSAQKRPDAHCEVVAQAPPCGTGVLVGVADDVTVGVRVGVAVGVAVGVFWTHDPSAVQLVPAAQQALLWAVSQQVSPALEQQTVPPPQSLPLLQQSPNSTLQTAAELAQQPPSGQLTPLAQHSPSAVQLVPAAQHCTPHACPDGQQLPPMQVWPVVQH